MIEPLLLTTARVSTFFGTQLLTGASGFFFERDARLYLVTNRHVLIDKPSRHLPDRIEIEVHTDAENLTRSAVLSVLLYIGRQAFGIRDGIPRARSMWRRSSWTRAALPASVALRCFTPAHLLHSLQEVEVGTPLLVVGFPMSFHDTLHHLPVVRQAVIASSFGLRFQGQGYFLTDARTHRSTAAHPS